MDMSTPNNQIYSKRDGVSMAERAQIWRQKDKDWILIPLTKYGNWGKVINFIGPVSSSIKDSSDMHTTEPLWALYEIIFKACGQ